MKRTIFYALIALISLSFTSCEKTNATKSKELLLGKWTVSDVAETEYLNDKLQWSETEADYGADYFIEFLSNGEYMSSIWGIGTYSLSEDAGRIYLREDGETNAYYYTITELSKTDLTMQYSETEKDEDGTWRWEIQYHFTK